MNWKKALLVVVILGIAFVMLVAATIGVAVTAVAATVVDSGIVEPIIEAVDEVTAGADRLHIELDESSITFTNPDNGRSRVIIPGVRVQGERLELNGPKITIIDPENGETRVIVPDLPRVPRIVVDGNDHQVYWSHNPLAPIGFFFRGMGTLFAVALIATGAYLLLKNRKEASAKEKVDTL
jgi:hypothetical protein